MTNFGTMWRRGFVLAASVALLAAAVPGLAAAQDDEVVVMTYFGADEGQAALLELLAQYTEDVRHRCQVRRCRARGLQDRHPHPARGRKPA